jgi:CHASE3 domain sensor protein
MRLLCGIVAFTIFCMFAVAVVTDHMADAYLFRGAVTPSSRVHLINDVTVALKHAQDCRKAYLLTGDNSYLNAYRSACADVDVRMDRLVSEDHAVTNKLAHAADLREFVHEKLSEIGKALESGPAARTPDTLPVVDGDLARIQKVLDSLAQEEARDVSGEMEAASARTIFHRNLAIAIAVINLLFLAGVAFCAIQIGKLYSLVTMCAWSKRVQYQNQWIPLEEYMRKRFGIRISHGISQEEYDKWAVSETADESLQGERPAPTPLPAREPSKKAAA